VSQQQFRRNLVHARKLRHVSQFAALPPVNCAATIYSFDDIFVDNIPDVYFLLQKTQVDMMAYLTKAQSEGRHSTRPF